MLRSACIVLGIVLFAGLLWAESTRSPATILLFKTPLSALFVLAAFLQAHPHRAYYRLVFGGLLLGFVGDISLALPGLTAFRCGLAAFLAGHVLYVVAFRKMSRSSDWLHGGSLLVLVASAAVFLWLLPRLGGMLIPVLLYIVIISAMVVGAWAVLRNPGVGRTAAWLIIVGALSFYLSDVFVARDRFVTNEFMNRLIGLPLYYVGQFCLAFSVGYVDSIKD